MFLYAKTLMATATIRITIPTDTILLSFTYIFTSTIISSSCFIFISAFIKKRLPLISASAFHALFNNCFLQLLNLCMQILGKLSDQCVKLLCLAFGAEVQPNRDWRTRTGWRFGLACAWLCRNGRHTFLIHLFAQKHVKRHHLSLQYCLHRWQNETRKWFCYRQWWTRSSSSVAHPDK